MYDSSLGQSDTKIDLERAMVMTNLYNAYSYFIFSIVPKQLFGISGKLQGANLDFRAM